MVKWAIKFVNQKVGNVCSPVSVSDPRIFFCMKSFSKASIFCSLLVKWYCNTIVSLIALFILFSSVTCTWVVSLNIFHLLACNADLMLHVMKFLSCAASLFSIRPYAFLSVLSSEGPTFSVFSHTYRVIHLELCNVIFRAADYNVYGNINGMYHHLLCS